MLLTAETATPAQAAARALGLSAVVCRAHMEAAARDAKAKEMQDLVLQWLVRTGAGRALTGEERGLVSSPLGSLEREDRATAYWRVEQLGVLAWALGRAPLARHDESPHDRTLARRVGFLRADAAAWIVAAALRSEVELRRYAVRAEAIAARLKQFALEEKPLDFKSFCLDQGIADVSFVDDDLEIAGLPLAAAPTRRWQTALCAALERDRAARWLIAPRLVAVRQPVDA